MKLSLTTARWLSSLLGWPGVCGVCPAADVDYFADNGYGNPVSNHFSSLFGNTKRHWVLTSGGSS